MSKQNKEETVKSELLFDGKVIKLYKDEVLCPNDKTAYREIVKHPGGAAILAIHDGNVLLVKQFRYAYKETIYEIPAGKLNENEDPYLAALRELEEETGYKTDKLEKLGEIYPTPGYTNEIIRIYLATNLIPSKQHLDEDEFLDVFEVSLDKFKQMVYSGEIKDAKSIAALVYYENRK